jgi:protoheme IX farnesyltransferase
MSGLLTKKSISLYRLPIAFFTVYSAVTGHLLGPAASIRTGIPTAAAVFILAAGASALNQYQERNFDSRMKRTRFRPLPSGLVSVTEVLSVSCLAILFGVAVLAFAGGLLSFLLGVLAVVWYNGVYTLLKRSTAFAAVPGAVVGMIPPAIGWSTSGGNLADPRLFFLCFLFFMWQVPHFWLQVLDHGEEYENAGLPTLAGLVTKAQIARITFAWIAAVAASGLMLPLYGALTSPFLYGSLVLPGAIWTVLKGLKLLSRQQTQEIPRSAFRTINAFLLLVMMTVTIDSLLVRLR